MFEHFEKYITAQVDLSANELQQILSLASYKKLRRKQFLLQEGDICRYKIFVIKGLLRTYRVGEDGTEYTMRFTPENTWTVEHESYNQQAPSRFYIEALEAAEVLLWKKEDADKLLDTIPAFRAFSEDLKSMNLNASQDRILMNISASSEEKYEQFITSFPDIFNRVPLHMVASYLGVSRETLSRIRHARLKQ